MCVCLCMYIAWCQDTSEEPLTQGTTHTHTLFFKGHLLRIMNIHKM